MNALEVYYIFPSLFAVHTIARRRSLYIYINVGLSTLLVSINWAMREPLHCGTSNRFGSTFFVYSLNMLFVLSGVGRYFLKRYKAMSNAEPRLSPYLLFNTRDELTRVDLSYVVYFEADGNYTHIIFSNGCKVMLLVSLANIEHLIDDVLKGQVQPFIRIGKSYIVNSRFIFQINLLKQKLFLTNFLSPQIFTLSVSKEALKNLKELYTKRK